MPSRNTFGRGISVAPEVPIGPEIETQPEPEITTCEEGLGATRSYPTDTDSLFTFSDKLDHSHWSVSNRNQSVNSSTVPNLSISHHMKVRASYRGVFQSLCDICHIWTAKDLSKATKICVYETVLSVLLYNTETWCLTATQAKRLKVFEMACLRKIDGVTRRDRIRNEEIDRREESE